MTWLAQMEARRLVLSLREMLVRLDENLAANTLLQSCVPYICEGDPEIERARQDQAQMVEHILDPACYEPYYRENHHERPFEQQYQCTAQEAHERLHRVRFLRTWLQQAEQASLRALTLLDCACNDGWMAKNLEGLAIYHGIDLNPHCLERAEGREVAGAQFARGFAEDAEDLLRQFRSKPKGGYDAVIAYELVEHVKDPDAVLAAMAACAKPGGSLFVSTPLGACTGGDLPEWYRVEPKGHVRAFTPRTFGELLTRHASVEEIQVSQAQQGHLMVARATTPLRTERPDCRASRLRVSAHH